MLKVISYITLVPLGGLTGLIASFVITSVLVGGGRDYYAPLFVFVFFAAILGTAGGVLGGYYAWHFSQALETQAIDIRNDVEAMNANRDDKPCIDVQCPNCMFEEVLPIRMFGERHACSQCGVMIDICATDWDTTQHRN